MAALPRASARLSLRSSVEITYGNQPSAVGMVMPFAEPRLHGPHAVI